MYIHECAKHACSEGIPFSRTFIPISNLLTNPLSLQIKPKPSIFLGLCETYAFGTCLFALPWFLRDSQLSPAVFISCVGVRQTLSP